MIFFNSREEKEAYKRLVKPSLIGMTFFCIQPKCRGGQVAGWGSQFDPCTGECSGPPVMLQCPMCNFGTVIVTKDNYNQVWQDALKVFWQRGYTTDGRRNRPRRC